MESNTVPVSRPAQAASPRWRRLAARLNPETVGLPAVLVVLYVVFINTAPNFATTDNQLNILQDAAFVGIVAFAMTLVIIAAEIDISVGSAVALGSALLGVLNAKAGVPLLPAVLIVFAEGALVGLAAGAIRAYFAVPSFIVTLALFLGLRGLAMLITDAFPVPIANEGFARWGSGDVAGIPVPAIIVVLVFLVFLFVANRTAFGRSVYAVGGNVEAARLSGIPINRIYLGVFALSGLMAAGVAVLQTSRLGSGNPNIGSGLEFDAIAAVIIGGTSLSGGRGSMIGTLIGVIFITVLGNGMVLLGVNPYAQQVVRGGVVLIAVLISSLRSRAARA